ncbi:MAG: adenine glycosylase [Coriobacteriia bacterium]|nr:adenine glycosylase [Coriobacteriia bacterium]MBS5478078.1 adenine glycosylase [Coriobacteriia bacterium]
MATKRPIQPPEIPLNVPAFQAKIREEGARTWRDLPWRHTHDAYEIWISEVMLQQTQVARVQTRWEEWLDRFPTVDALAVASDADVLAAWQGMGYNRRALALHEAARRVSEDHGGAFPREREALLALPGVGPSTAAGIRAFAFDEPDVYLETNVRAVFIHELFPTAQAVADASLVPLVRQACSATDVRGWYYALLDYGAWLKRSIPNPTRRATAYTRQSRFEGSHRQKRAFVLRALLDARQTGAQGGMAAPELADALSAAELKAGRAAVDEKDVEAILAELAREGFCRVSGGLWHAGSGA